MILLYMKNDNRIQFLWFTFCGALHARSDCQHAFFYYHRRGAIHYDGVNTHNASILAMLSTSDSNHKCGYRDPGFILYKHGL